MSRYILERNKLYILNTPCIECVYYTELTYTLYREKCTKCTLSEPIYIREQREQENQNEQ